MPNVAVVYHDTLPAAHHSMIMEGLQRNAYAQRGVGQQNGPFSFTIASDNSVCAAGIAGFCYYGCCYIDLLYVEEHARGRGYGSLLMHHTTALATARHCLFMAVNTMDFEAKPFYAKHGFIVEFTREGFEHDTMMYYMRKPLV